MTSTTYITITDESQEKLLAARLAALEEELPGEILVADAIRITATTARARDELAQALALPYPTA